MKVRFNIYRAIWTKPWQSVARQVWRKTKISSAL